MYRTILVPVDLDEPSSWAMALPTARALCDRFKSSLALVTVISDLTLALQAQWSQIAYREMVERARVQLLQLAEEAGGREPAECHVETGSIYAGILAVAKRIDADLIVLASHRPAMKDYLLGANASRIVRHAPCSVFVVRVKPE
jgi:nucleotide-binding universal stress UspA family protein